MNSCRVSRKGSGVVFGQSVFHMVRCYPKTTPDPLGFRTSRTKYDTHCFAGPNWVMGPPDGCIPILHTTASTKWFSR